MSRDERIDGALPAMPKVKEHHKALPYREVPGALKVIGSRVSSARLCLRFLILTATRSNEVREATWDEIDRESKTWTIPGERMKARETSPRSAFQVGSRRAQGSRRPSGRIGSDLSVGVEAGPGDVTRESVEGLEGDRDRQKYDDSRVPNFVSDLGVRADRHPARGLRTRSCSCGRKRRRTGVFT